MFEGWGAAVVGAAVVGGVVASNQSSKASKAQQAASQAGIDAENYRFDQATQILQPYVDVGTGTDKTKGSLVAQQDLLGLNGQDAQKMAVDAIQNGAEFQALSKQGEDAILQNASATGGLRSGNTQSALAQFRPQLLSQLINDQYGKLSGLTQIGQASAAKSAANNIQQGQDTATLLGQIGAAKAGNSLAQGKIFNDTLNTVVKVF